MLIFTSLCVINTCLAILLGSTLQQFVAARIIQHISYAGTSAQKHTRVDVFNRFAQLMR